MSEQDQVRAELAALLAATIDAPVAAFIPSTVRTGCGYLQHGEPYMDFTGDFSAFRRPALRLELVLVAAATDWDRAMAWIDDKVNLIRLMLAEGKPTVAGHVRPTVTAVTAVGVLDAKAIAFAVAFTPIQLGAVT